MGTCSPQGLLWAAATTGMARTACASMRREPLPAHGRPPPRVVSHSPPHPSSVGSCQWGNQGERALVSVHMAAACALYLRSSSWLEWGHRPLGTLQAYHIADLDRGI